jgi:hypothetical protein
MVEDRLGEPIKYCILRNIIMDALSKSKNLRLLSDVQKERIMNHLNNRIMSSGSTLFKKGEDMDAKLVLLIEGTLTTSQGEKYCDTVTSFVNEAAFFEQK